MKSRLNDFLETHNAINLAYTDENGRPQASALWYVSDTSFQIYYLSSLTTLHGRSLKNGGQVAFTINQDKQEWDKIRGIQGRGTVRLLEGDEHKEFWRLYTEKFPFVTEQFSELGTALEKTKAWVITPHWLRLIDNTIGFAHKEEWINDDPR
ncbi:MAG: pyridoxamine 5'-phosphate oxidase family protein [Candidatus Kariarchaeaceae archaeon]